MFENPHNLLPTPRPGNVSAIDRCRVPRRTKRFLLRRLHLQFPLSAAPAARHMPLCFRQGRSLLRHFSPQITDTFPPRSSRPRLRSGAALCAFPLFSRASRSASRPSKHLSFPHSGICFFRKRCQAKIKRRTNGEVTVDSTSSDFPHRLFYCG